MDAHRPRISGGITRSIFIVSQNPFGRFFQIRFLRSKPVLQFPFTRFLSRRVEPFSRRMVLCFLSFISYIVYSLQQVSSRQKRLSGCCCLFTDRLLFSNSVRQLRGLGDAGTSMRCLSHRFYRLRLLALSDQGSTALAGSRPNIQNVCSWYPG